VVTDTTQKNGVDVLCDVKNLVKTFDYQSFDIVISNIGNIRNYTAAIQNIKDVCKSGGIVVIGFKGSEWEFTQKNIKEIFNDFNIETITGIYMKAKKDLKKSGSAKATPKKVRKITRPVAKYIGDSEVYFPSFKKIVNKGDLVEEMPLDEAAKRSDFIVIEREE